MESVYQVIAILTAGISLTMGFFSLLTYLYKGREKVNLVFALLCLLVVVFILLPTVGFIIADTAPYSTSTRIKRVFNLSFIALLPWFIACYTAYKEKLLPYVVTVSIVISYGIMFFTSTESPHQLWVLVAMITLAIIPVYAFFAGYHQFKTGQKAKAISLFIAITIFSLFNLVGAINHFNASQFTAAWKVVSLPVNLCPLAFILIMGIQLQANPREQERREKMIGLKETWWQSLLEDIHLVIVNTNLEGKITYINSYGVQLLNYKNPAEIIDTNLSDHCLKQHTEKAQQGEGHTAIVPDRLTEQTTTIVTKDGKEKIIKWSSEIIRMEDGGLAGKMHIGSDITGLEEAIRQIRELKAELEKENLPPVKEQVITPGLNQDRIGSSRPFIYAIQKSKQVAPTNASVLLLGETGVGKESFADLIQETSLRRSMPFVKVNCGALPAELIEDELFGHEKGAFTGAINSRMGRFEKANGGTIFLDEIGELPISLQPKLLRVLQNGEFERVGGHQTIKVDVRVIAATNNDLEKEVRENRFREDLFYRLNVFPITIPPLRKRTGDIHLLIQSFIERKSKEHGKHFDNISKADMNRLCDYEWPGNIRQLKNVIERAVISSENNTLKLDWFYEDIENNPQQAATASLEEIETAYIVKVLQECRWKINGENGAAEKLVMHPNTLRSRMKKLNINVPWKQD